MTNRHMDRIIRHGQGTFWTYRRNNKQVYLTGLGKLSIKLTELALSKNDITIETNHPGRQRMWVDLSGDLEQAIANTYAAWFASKGEHITISRDTLMALWNVTLPTLTRWEERSGIIKTKNFAQSHETSIDKVPSHAYLCRNREDGSEYTTWQLPNTYHAPKTIQQHPNIGNAAIIREEVKALIDTVPKKHRGSLRVKSQPSKKSGQGTLRLGRLYFERKGKRCGWTMCNRHLIKHGDVFKNHYVRLGTSRGVTLYERFDVATSVQHTRLWQRDMRGENDEELGRKMRWMNYPTHSGNVLCFNLASMTFAR